MVEDGDARAQPFIEKSAETIATEVERVAKETNRWPRCGWPHSTVTAWIEKLLKLGIRQTTIIDGIIWPPLTISSLENLQIYCKYTPHGK